MMFVLTVAVSRAVPLLFLFSALLVVGRFLYDRYRPANPTAATAVFLAVPLLGVLGAGPYILRSGALVAAELSVSLEKWENVDRFYELHYRLGGRPALRLHYNWVSALMNLERWPDAEEKLLFTVRTEGDRAIAAPQTIYLLGVARYYQGRFPAAAKTLSAVADGEAFFLKPYLLGRIAEHEGRSDDALLLYERCVALRPDFLGALYQAVRLRLDRGDAAGARELWRPYRDTTAGADDPTLREVDAALANGRRLPEMEFRVVQFQS
jgi:tetratricopeptide (TPR) repeat protein